MKLGNYVKSNCSCHQFAIICA